MPRAVFGVVLCMYLLSCGDGGSPATGSGFCWKWCRACEVCTGLNIQEGDCLDNGGSFCLSQCEWIVPTADESCQALLVQHGKPLDQVIAAPDWLGCKVTVDRDNPFDTGVCPELSSF